MLRLTNSEMSDFRRCKRKWYVRHHLQLAPITEGLPGGALWIGNLVHDALAYYYEDVAADVPGGAGVIWSFQRALGDRLAADPVLQDAIMKEAELPRLMIEGYAEWLREEGVDSDLKILGAERFVEVAMEGDVTLLTKLDAPVERVSDGAKLAIEHKTVGTTLEVKMEGAKIDTQYLTEHLARFLESMEQGATAEEAIDQCQGVLLNMLRKVKRTAKANPPFYHREPVTHNVNELRNHWKHVMSIAWEIKDAHSRLDAGEDHHTVCPPSPMESCSWQCPLYQICVLADDGSDFEGALDGLFEAKDPLARYANAVKA